METRGPGVHSFEAFRMIPGHLVQYASPLKDIIGSFCYHPQGQPRAQEGVEKWIPGSLASTVLKLLT